MYFRAGSFGILLGIAILVAVSFPRGAYGEEVHVVRRGDTFFSIARSFGLSADELMRHNGISDPSRLQVGQRLRIPGTDQVTDLQGGEEMTYRVVRGDTFFGLSRRFSVTERSIREINNLADNYVLREGDLLKIPGTRAPAIEGQSVRPVLNAADASQARPMETGRVSAGVSWPIRAGEINYMAGRLSGVMITGQMSESVISLTHGTVISVGPYRGFGRVAIVQVDGGYLYVYGGCEVLSVKEGDRVSPGTEIGRLGLDAISNRPQLFFMVYRSNAPIDPATAPRA